MAAVTICSDFSANTGDTSLITGPGRCHMLWAAKPMMPEFPRAHAPQQEKPPLATTREKPTHCNEDPLQLKIKIKKDFWLELKFFKRGLQVLGWESESNHWGVCILFSEKPLMERRQNNLFYSFSLWLHVEKFKLSFLEREKGNHIHENFGLS